MIQKPDVGYHCTTLVKSYSLVLFSMQSRLLSYKKVDYIKLGERPFSLCAQIFCQKAFQNYSKEPKIASCPTFNLYEIMKIHPWLQFEFDLSVLCFPNWMIKCPNNYFSLLKLFPNAKLIKSFLVKK